MPDPDAQVSNSRCRHDFMCEGWTVDPATSTCLVCGKAFVFWSVPLAFDEWLVGCSDA